MTTNYLTASKNVSETTSFQTVAKV